MLDPHARPSGNDLRASTGLTTQCNLGSYEESSLFAISEAVLRHHPTSVLHPP
jgi:hypothetical protein